MDFLASYQMDTFQAPDACFKISFLQLRAAFARCQITIPTDRFHQKYICYKGSLVEPFAKFCAGSPIGTMGAWSYSNSPLPHGLAIGRYTSIGEQLRIFGARHFPAWVSTSPYIYQSNYVTTDMPLDKISRNSHAVTIGSDVWIGSHVALKERLHIGDGAIIATGSVVTKDVPPYAVVGGNPARILKYRFPEPIMEKMLALRWWRFALPDLRGLSMDKPETFLALLEKKIDAQTLTPFMPPVLTADELLQERERHVLYRLLAKI